MEGRSPQHDTLYMNARNRLISREGGLGRDPSWPLCSARRCPESHPWSSDMFPLFMFHVELPCQLLHSIHNPLIMRNLKTPVRVLVFPRHVMNLHRFAARLSEDLKQKSSQLGARCGCHKGRAILGPKDKVLTRCGMVSAGCSRQLGSQRKSAAMPAAAKRPAGATVFAAACGCC